MRFYSLHILYKSWCKFDFLCGTQDDKTFCKVRTNVWLTDWPSCCPASRHTDHRLAVQCHEVSAESDTTHRPHWMTLRKHLYSAAAASTAGLLRRCASTDDHETSCTSRPTYTTLVSVHDTYTDRWSRDVMYITADVHNASLCTRHIHSQMITRRHVHHSRRTQR